MTIPKRKIAKKKVSGLINQLPDELLIHIISFLTTKEAVATSLLSKRWNKLWAQVPALNFDSANFIPQDYSEDPKYCCEKFKNFVTSTLTSLEVPQLDAFRLVWEHQPEFDTEPLLEWIPRIVELKPRSIHISVCATSDDLTLPDSIFTCESLEELELRIDTSLPVYFNSQVIKLPRLKSLSLSFMDMNSETMNNLLLGCPLLEELEFQSCTLNFSEVSSSTLKTLIVHDCDLDQEIKFPSLISIGCR